MCVCVCVGEPGTLPAEETWAENREDGIIKEEKMRLMKSNEQNKREKTVVCFKEYKRLKENTM